MKFIPVTILILLFASIAYAGSLNEQIEAIQKTYQDIETISADFTQTTYVKLIDKTVTKQGKFYFKKGGKLRIEYKGDPEKHYVSDGTKLWIYNVGDKASQQEYELNDETIPKEALSFLAGFGKLNEEFKIKKSQAFENVEQNFSALELIPKNKSAQYKTLDTLFNQDNYLVKLRVRNPSGNITNYTFTNIQINQNLEDGFFQVNKKISNQK
ncbi:MAG: outer membrane lipoprotein carrier protein LolA [Pseudomonadota bacterium]